jgi:hypothetical protein
MTPRPALFLQLALGMAVCCVGSFGPVRAARALWYIGGEGILPNQVPGSLQRGTVP